MATISISKNGLALGAQLGYSNAILSLSESTLSKYSNGLIELKRKVDFIPLEGISVNIQVLHNNGCNIQKSVSYASRKMFDFINNVYIVDDKVAGKVHEIGQDFDIIPTYSYSGISHINNSEKLNRHLMAALKSISITTNNNRPQHGGGGISRTSDSQGNIRHHTVSRADGTTVEYDYIVDDVYSNENPYGSYQGGAYRIANASAGEITREEREYLDIIKKNKNKNMTDEELANYLNEMREEGCGYASIVNTTFEYYSGIENGEELFRDKFGFSYRRNDGTLNFNLLMVYVYSKYDDSKEQGLSQSDEDDIIKKVMAEKGVKGNGSVKVKTSSYDNLTNDEIKKYLAEGKQVIISSKHVVLYNMDGTVKQNCAGAGHSLSVTGVTSDGRIIVSSWGKQLYVDRKDDGKFQHRWGSAPGDSIFSFGWMDLKFSVVEF